MLGPLTFSMHLGAAKDLRRHCRMGIHRVGAAALGTCYSSCSCSWQVVAAATCSVLGLLVVTCCCFSEAVVVATCCSSLHERVEATC